jgi:hypothetical protein
MKVKVQVIIESDTGQRLVEEVAEYDILPTCQHSSSSSVAAA